MDHNLDKVLKTRSVCQKLRFARQTNTWSLHKFAIGFRTKNMF